MYLQVAVVAPNYKLSCKAVRELAENDMDTEIESIEKTNNIRAKITMKDGTVYKAYATDQYIRGILVDQLILVDDSRWEVLYQQRELINQLKTCLCRSCVPEDFLIQKYEW